MSAKTAAAVVRPDKSKPMVDVKPSITECKAQLQQPPCQKKSVTTVSATVKKEVFQWNTPADEFADDVGSDTAGESDHEDVAVISEISRGRDHVDDIIINLGNLDGLAKVRNGVKFVGHYDAEEQRRLREQLSECNKAPLTQPKKKKKYKSKQKFPCPRCDKVWNWPWELRRHLVMHFKEKERQDASAFKCDKCGKGFQWKRDLAQHQRLHTGEKLLVCSVCSKKFTTRQALLHHVVVHTGEKPFQCAECGNRFTQPANLRTHMKKKHDGLQIKGNKCPHCQEVLPSVVAVNQHILEDHQNIVAEQREAQAMEKLKKENEKLQKELAKAESRRKREEKRRMRADLNDFRKKGLLEWEINYEFHIGDGFVRGVDWDRTPSNGELACDICERKFGWRYEIMFHHLCHMNDEDGQAKNKVCPECETVFKVPIGLKHHLLIHTGELPFLCLHCWRSFSSHIDLKLHLRREHLTHLDEAAASGTTAPKKKRVADLDASGSGTVDSAVEKTKVASANGRKKVKTETAIAASATAMQFVAVPDGEISQDGTQTIVLGTDDSVVGHDANQDMIVVIQSDDFDQSQGLIVVDPSQLQHVVSAEAIVQDSDHSNATAMIIGEDNSASHHQLIVSDSEAEGGTQYINLEFADQVVAAEDGSTILLQSSNGQHFTTTSTNYVVVSSSTADSAGPSTTTTISSSSSSAPATSDYTEPKPAFSQDDSQPEGEVK